MAQRIKEGVVVLLSVLHIQLFSTLGLHVQITPTNKSRRWRLESRVPLSLLCSVLHQTLLSIQLVFLAHLLSIMFYQFLLHPDLLSCWITLPRSRRWGLERRRELATPSSLLCSAARVQQQQQHPSRLHQVNVFYLPGLELRQKKTWNIKKKIVKFSRFYSSPHPAELGCTNAESVSSALLTLTSYSYHY